MLRPSKFLFLGLSLLLIGGCETDVDVIAPQRDMTIVYGLLEANKSRHYIRINRAFVGEEAASVMAAEPGINEYQAEELTAKVIELSGEENPTGREWILEQTYFNTKEEGAFFSDSNKVYYFDATLDVNRLYKLECTVNVAGEETKTVTAITDVLGNRSSTGTLEEVVLSKPKLKGTTSTNGEQNRDGEVSLVNSSGYATNYEVQWGGVSGGAKYTTYVRLFYTDYYDNGSVIRDSVTYSIGTKSSDPNSSGTVTFSMNAEDFYSTLGQRVPDHDTISDDFVRLVSDTLQFFVEIANDELSTYIEINQPVTGVLQDRPEYTNVDNGIGIFASRLVSSTRSDDIIKNGRLLDNRTMEELLYSNLPESGDYTRTKGFLNDRCTVKSTGPVCQ